MDFIKTSLCVAIMANLAACNQNDHDQTQSAPQVSQLLTPANVIVGQETLFVIKGDNIHNSVGVTVENCANLSISNQLSSQINFSCTPNVQGEQTIRVKDSANNTLFSQKVTVICPTGQLSNNGQCFVPQLTWNINPSSGFLVNSEFCGNCVQGVKSYRYDWGDGSAVQNSVWQNQTLNSSHNYTNAGTYTLTLTLSDATNRQVSQTKTVVVSAKGVINVLPKPVMAGDSISLQVTDVLDDIKSVVWTIGGSISSVVKAIGEALTSVFSAGEQVVQAQLKDGQGRTINTLNSTLAVQAVCGLGQTAQNYLCVDVPLTVTSISPNTLTQNQKTKITLVGTNLPATAMFTLENSVCEAPIEQSETSISQLCTVQFTGNATLTAKYKSDVEAGKVTFTVAVNPDSEILVIRLLNDTGITQCADDTTLFSDCSAVNLGGWFGLSQDGQTGRDVLLGTGQLTKVGGGDAGFDFTKISATGQKLPANALAWSCVLDNRTGLMWEVKTNDGGLHGAYKTYSWYNIDATTNGGSVGYENGGNNTQAFTQAVNQQGLCGYSDWYVPDYDELISIVNYGTFKPAIDTNYFTNTQNGYWSSSPDATNGNFVWVVYFSYGSSRSAYKDDSLFVRLVRASQ